MLLIMSNIVCINNSVDFEALFKLPFERKKIIYSINSDFFRQENNYYKLGEKQLAIDIDDDQFLHNSLSEFPCGENGCRAMFSTVHEYEVHYRSVHRLVCSECKRNFPSYNLLDAHILESHDSFYKAAADKNIVSHDCFVEGCDQKFSSIETRNEHVIKTHNYPPDFQFQKLKQQKHKDEAMDVTQFEDSCSEVKPASSSRIKYNVPKTICFGRGSHRAFTKKNRGQSSRDITMKELADALEN